MNTNSRNRKHTRPADATKWFAVALAALLAFTCTLSATRAAEVTLDGTSGSNSIGTGYSTDGNLTVNLGFFAEYLIVGGGGGGGNGRNGTRNRGGGGGGAGGLRTNVGGALLQVGAASHPVEVGAGGAAGGFETAGSNGGNSSFFDITALGGGGGAGYLANAGSGGSGGGGSGVKNPGGSGTTGQGYAGGTGEANGAGYGGGGGGAGQAGKNSSGIGGNGGNGLQNAITGTTVWYAGGGGGRRTSSGGLGGGGAGNDTATPGTDGLGGGGGGGTTTGAGKGGSGVVIVRYAGSQAGNGGAVSPVSGATVHQFTGDGALDLSGLDLDARLGVTLTTGITGSGDLIYNGPGALTLSGANNYSGATTINGGTLKLGADNVLPSTAVFIGAATLAADTRTDTVGTLALTGAATIQLDSGAALAFADSHLVDWTGGTLNLTGIIVPGSSLRFGADSNGLTPAQLALISINGSGAGTCTLDAGGYLVVPTATTITAPATLPGSLSTTHGTASAARSVAVSGGNLTEDITATAQTGFEVSANGSTFSATATFTRQGDNTAAGTLYVRLAATAVIGSYDSVTAAILSSSGATSANVATSASGNTVSNPTDGVWTLDGDGNWSTADNWQDSVIADGLGKTAWFTHNITAIRIVTIDGSSRTVGTLNIGDSNNSHSFTLAASWGATLTLDNSGSAAQINQLSTSRGDACSVPLVLSGGLDVSNASANALALSGIISGTGPITATGSAASSLILSGANTYTGGTVIDGGRLQFNSGAVPDTGQITINSAGVLAATGAYAGAADWLGSGKIATGSAGVLALTANNGAAVNLSTGGHNDLYLGATGAFDFGNYVLTPGANGYLLGGGGGTLTLSRTGALGAGKNLTVGGNVTLSAANTAFNGTVAVNAGTLTLRDPTALGSTIPSITGAGNVTFHANETTYTLSAASSYLGTTTLSSNNETVGYILGTANALPTTTVLMFANVTGQGSGRTSTFDLTGFSQQLGGMEAPVNGQRRHRIRNTSGPAATLTINDNGTRTFNGTLEGNFGVVKNGTGTWTLAGQTFNGSQYSNSHNGGTILNQGGITLGNLGTLGATTGTLQVNNNNSTAAGTDVVLTLPTGADLTVGSLSGAIATPISGINTARLVTQIGRTFTVNQTADGTYAGTITGAGSFTLGSLSTHTLTLTGANTYSGGTAVNGGTLLVNGSLAAGTAVTVNGPGTLGGTGTINRATSVLSGGTLSPGASVGTLTFGAGLTLQAGANLVMELGTSSDLVRVSSGSSITGPASGTVNLNVTDSGGLGEGAYTLIDWTGATPSGVDVSDFTVTMPGGWVGNVSVDANKLVLNVTPVPPPTVFIFR